MEALLLAIRSILDGEEHCVTVRHLFYRLVGVGAIPKTETAYKSLIGHLSKWRRSHEIAWDAFADSTRWHIRGRTFDGIADALQRTCETYRRDMWSTQPHYVELWLEKDAIASIVADVADDFGVLFSFVAALRASPVFTARRRHFARRSASGKNVTIFH